MPHDPLLRGSIIGIVGGGQLGRMLSMAASSLGFLTHIYSDEPHCPASQVATKTTHASYDDEEALKKFGSSVDVITCEFENIPARTLNLLNAIKPVRPNPEAFAIAQDRKAERLFLSKNSIPHAPYHLVSSENDLSQALETLGTPLILKTTRMGYDGKGQAKITNTKHAIEAWQSIGGSECIAEKMISFTKEISIIACRSTDGATVFYDCAENVHKNHILHTSNVPANIHPKTEQTARDCAQKIAAALDYCGTIGIEFFVVEEKGTEKLIVNEIAPRVHNSGHWTMDACAIDQFENHIRAICLWPPGSTTRHSDACMTNLLGDEILSLGQWAMKASVALHDYGKENIKAGRKMGHITQLFEKT